MLYATILQRVFTVATAENQNDLVSQTSSVLVERDIRIAGGKQTAAPNGRQYT